MYNILSSNICPLGILQLCIISLLIYSNMCACLYVYLQIVQCSSFKSLCVLFTSLFFAFGKIGVIITREFMSVSTFFIIITKTWKFYANLKPIYQYLL